MEGREIGLVANILVIISLTCMVITCAHSVPYKELYIDQHVDHFNFVSFGESIFKERYLVQGLFVMITHDQLIFELTITLFLCIADLAFNVFSSKTNIGKILNTIKLMLSTLI